RRPGRGGRRRPRRRARAGSRRGERAGGPRATHEGRRDPAARIAGARRNLTTPADRPRSRLPGRPRSGPERLPRPPATRRARMEQRAFGWTGAAVPVIGQGTWNLERDDRTSAVAALRAGLDAGMTHVDTAEMYGSGRVEEIVGRAIAGRRDEVFLVSKVLPQNATYDGVLHACEGSLRRLGTDRLDLYLLHWPGRHPLERTLA